MHEIYVMTRHVNRSAILDFDWLFNLKTETIGPSLASSQASEI